MGVIFAKLRRKKTSAELLEKLDKEIRSIESYRRDTELTQKRIIGRFLVLSFILYLIAAGLIYCYFYPPNIKEKLLYTIPFCLAPFLILCTKRILSWYYNRKITKNEKKLVNLYSEKKKALEQIMETETYKVARSILEKYAPAHTGRSTLTPRSDELAIKPYRFPDANTSVRNRFPSPRNEDPALASWKKDMDKSNVNDLIPQIKKPMLTVNNQLVPQASALPLPRDILPRHRSVLDKMVEYLVGDGPSNRYALICKQCAGHNGMALQEEFEYISFKCCYCYTFHPSRKQRPVAPKLLKSEDKNVHTDTSESENNSGSDTEHDEEESPKKETMYAKEEAKSSDNEPVSDFDKLSDIEAKNTDTVECQNVEDDKVESTTTEQL